MRYDSLRPATEATRQETQKEPSDSEKDLRLGKALGKATS